MAQSSTLLPAPEKTRPAAAVDFRQTGVHEHPFGATPSLATHDGHDRWQGAAAESPLTHCVVEVRSSLHPARSRTHERESTVRNDTPARRLGPWARFLRRSVIDWLARLERGSLTITDNLGAERLGHDSHGEVAASITVLDPRFYQLVASGGDLGAGEAYLRGYWQSDDLVNVVRLLARNRQTLEQVGRGWSWATAPLLAAARFLHRNTKRGSRRNIYAHYDLGNDFFRLFLDGMMAIQAITIPDQRYDRYRKSIDFIQEYVFPGGYRPSLGAISRALRQTTDLQITHLEDFAEHYARTLSHWRARFHENLAEVRRLGIDDRFIRCWDYYLSYCEGAFAERQTGVSQIVFTKPDCRQPATFGGLS